MAKGIIFSLLTVFLLLPGVVVYCDKPISKAEHKTFSFKARISSRFSYKLRWALVLLAVIVAIPAALLTQQNTFRYGNSASQSADGDGIQSRIKTEEIFGTQEQLAVLVPKDEDKEAELTQGLSALKGVSSVQSRTIASESGLGELLPEKITAQLVGSDDFDRIVLLLDCEEEGEETKTLLNKIKSEIVTEYGNDADFYLLGNTAAALDMEFGTTEDFSRITLYSILAVALIVALTFRSLLIPVILVAVIESAVWINMAIPAITGASVIFLGYMIISNVLLGSTIDYAILLTSNYMEARDDNSVADSVRLAQSNSMRSILTSGIIFTVGGLMLGLMTTMPTVKLLGFAIMRGGICAGVMTIFVLPALLAVFDKPIRFLTIRRRHKE